MILPLVALPAADASPDESLSRLSLLGELCVAGAEGVPAAEVASYKPLLQACACRIGPFTFPPQERADWTDAAVAWLDSGAWRVIVVLTEPSVDAAEALAEWAKQLPESKHRLVASLPLRAFVPEKEPSTTLPKDLREVCDALRGAVGAVHLDFTGLGSEIAVSNAERKWLRGEEGKHTFLEVSVGNEGHQFTPAEIGSLHRGGSIHVVCGAFVASSSENSEKAKPAGKAEESGIAESAGSANGGGGAGISYVNAAAALVACARSDREDRLFTTVVADASGVALGLVYSNAESIAMALATGRGVYHSRSRGGLWIKGDTSGAIQELLGISLDCDSDALRFVVKQKGDPPAFCHLNRYACWPDGVAGAAGGGLGRLERALQERHKAAPVGSYTARLFNDAALLRNKLVEEAQELAEAEEPDHVASEAADVLYFALVRCVAAGVGVADIEKHLDRRALKLKRRPGNAKAYRIAAGDAILASKGSSGAGGGSSGGKGSSGTGGGEEAGAGGERR